MMQTFLEQLVKYLVSDGYSLDFSDKETSHATTRKNIVLAVARFAVKHLANIHVPYTGARYVSKTEPGELINIWMSMTQFTPLVFYKIKSGSIFIAIIIPADDLPSATIQEIVTTADQNGLNSRQCVMHMTQLLFIKQQAGGVFVELFFVFVDANKAEQFCAQHLEGCATSHRFKATYVNSCVINVSDRDVVINKRPFGFFQGNRGNKLREELFT